ncbi:MAG: YybS family protein [Acidobacteriota bacterium]|nr:YybS family protein [Acidobacteriota bacterium]
MTAPNGLEKPAPIGAHGALEIALAAAISSTAFGLFLALPLVGSIGLPLAGVPMVRLAHRRGGAAAVVASGLAGALVASVLLAAGDSGGWQRGALAAGLAVLPAIFASFARAGMDPSRAYLALSAGGTLILAGLFLGGAAASGQPVGDEIAGEFDRMIPAALESYTRSGMDAETVAGVRTTLQAAREFSRSYWAGLLGLLWVICAWISFYAGARAARPAPSAEATRFEALRVPAVVAPLFVAAGAGSVFLGPGLRPIAGSVLLPLFALYFVAGLSIICHFARRWFRVRLLRVGLYTLVAYFPMNVGVALLGLFDWYVDFRRLGAGATEKQ